VKVWEHIFTERTAEKTREIGWTDRTNDPIDGTMDRTIDG